MIGTLGTAALWSGLAASVAAVGVWPRGGRAGRVLAGMVLGSGAAAFLLLEWALVGHDFQVGFVARHGGLHVPLYYTLTSPWSGLEGSLVLWVLALGGYGFAVSRKGRDPRTRVAMAVIMAICACFFALVLFAANPFSPAVPVPVDGPGPNPLLRAHPLMGVHPPLLYLGFTGLAVPFAYGVASLVTGRAGRDAARVLRHWTLIAWIPLTAGIVLGAWWSYEVLGWGGYWEWDPVENASLIPWLTATALLHALMGRERGGGLRTWTVVLALSSFLLVLLGTFLTRSGVVASVHSFTQSAVGPALLGVFTAALVAAGGLLAWRPGFGGGRGGASMVAAGSVLLAALACTVLLGTLFPLLLELATGDRVSVGPPYFNRMTIPAALTLLVLMAAAPLMDRAGPGPRALAVPAAAGALTVVVLGLTGRHHPLPLVAFGLGAFALSAVAAGVRGLVRRHGVRGLRKGRGRRGLGAMVAHAGMALAAVAIAGSCAYAHDLQTRLRPGETVTVGDHVIRLDGVDRSRTADAMSTAARLSVLRDGATVAALRPQLTFYPATGAPPVAAPAVRTTVLDDLYVALVEADEAGATATLLVAVNPLMAVLWTAGLAVVLGGALALSAPASPSVPRTAPLRVREPAR